METDEYCVEKVSFYQLNLLRLDVVMTLIYSQYLAPFLIFLAPHPVILVLRGIEALRAEQREINLGSLEISAEGADPAFVHSSKPVCGREICRPTRFSTESKEYTPAGKG